MTLAEAQIWSSYIWKYGSLNTGRRIEQVVGGALAFYANSNRGKNGKEISPYAFMPHEQKPKVIEMDAEDYLNSWVGK